MDTTAVTHLIPYSNGAEVPSEQPQATATMSTSSDDDSVQVPGSTKALKQIKLTLSDLDKIERLDMAKHNWPTWSEAMRRFFFLNACGGYILGLEPRPSDATSAKTWDLNNLCVMAAIETRCTREEVQYLKGLDDAHEAWTTLQSRHEKLGLVAQFLLIQEAFGVQFRRSDRLTVTATKLGDLVARIYAIGVPKEDDFLLIVLMNAMSSELSPLRNHVADGIHASTVPDPYTSAHVFRRLEMEQQRIDGDKEQHALTLTVNSKGGKPSKVCSSVGHHTCCTNCSGQGHVKDQCWRPGGGRAGQRDAILAEKKVKRNGSSDSKATQSSTSKGNTHYDTSGSSIVSPNKQSWLSPQRKLRPAP